MSGQWGPVTNNAAATGVSNTSTSPTMVNSTVMSQNTTPVRVDDCLPNNLFSPDPFENKNSQPVGTMTSGMGSGPIGPQSKGIGAAIVLFLNY